MDTRNERKGPGAALWRLAIGILKGAALLALFPVSFAICSYIHEEARTERMAGAVPDTFPVLVFMPRKEGRGHHARIVFYGLLPKYLAQHPDHGFLVPDGEREAIREDLREQCKEELEANEGYPIRVAGYGVKQRAPGEQRITLRAESHDEEVNQGTYDATEKEVHPLYHTAYLGGLDIALTLLACATALTLLGWMLLPLMGFLRARRVWRARADRRAE